MGNSDVTEKNTMYKRNLIDIFVIANIVSDGIYVIDKNGVIVDVNECFADIIGIEESKLVGRNMQNVWDMEIYNKEESFIVLDHKDKMPMMAILNEIDNKKLESRKPRAVGLIALEEKRDFNYK